MYLRRRTILLLLVCLFLFAYQFRSSRYSIEDVKRLRKLRLYIEDDDPSDILIHEDNARPEPPPWKEVFPPGEAKPKGYQFTRAIVMARTKLDNASWVDEQLGDLLKPKGLFEEFIYVADDKTAPLHPVKNKGHEVMIYLTYIIDHYDELPDVAIFIHSDRFTWHNNAMMDDDLAKMIRYLRPERVIRDGFMNLRCHDYPGCPEYLHLSEHAKFNETKKEEQAISQKWKEVFPLEPMPPVLSQPCCAQFAVSRERIRAIPKERYIFLRTWITRTRLDDYRSGRVFEYTWQYIFTGNPVVCPVMSVCYCEGYGICFQSDAEFSKWIVAKEVRDTRKSRLVRLKETYFRDDEGLANDRPHPKVSLEVVRMIRDLEKEVDALEARLKKLKDDAILRGRSNKLGAPKRPGIDLRASKGTAM